MSQEIARFTPDAQAAGVSFIAMVTNLEIRERRLRTRARWRELKLESAPPDWATANTQGACPYNPGVGKTPVNPVTGAAGFIESAAGKMFRITPGSRSFIVEDISNGIVGVPSMRLANLVQARSYVVRTDWSSPTQIWDGTLTTNSTGYNKDAPPSSKLPNFAGPLVFGDRIWITNNETEVLAADHANRTDLVGNTDLINTRDQSYDFTSTSFKSPLEMGPVTSMNIVTSYRGGNLPSQAEIVMGTAAQGMWGILAGTPRAQWSTTSMRRIIHQTVAPTGPYASFASNDEMIFRTERGLASIKYISQEVQQIGNPLTNLAQEIKPLLDLDPKDLLPYTSLYVSPRYQRLICTLWPKVEGYHRWSRGWVSMALAPGRTRVPEAGVWEGVNTLPKAMGEPIQFIEVRDFERLRLLALTMKEDGTKGLVEWTSSVADDMLADGTSVRIPWQIHTRKLAASGEMSPSSWGNVFMSVTDIRDRVDLKIFARSRSHNPFKKVYEGSVTNRTWGTEERGLADDEPMSLGSLFESFKDPWLEILIQGEGCCAVDLAIQSVNSGNSPTPPQTSHQCIDGESLCGVDYFIRN